MNWLSRDHALTPCSLMCDVVMFQKGRPAMIYAIDRTEGQTTADLVTLFLRRGVNVADRDDVSGSSPYSLANVTITTKRIALNHK